MGRTMKRELLLVLAAVVMIIMIPAMMAAIGVRTPGIEAAYAGDGIDIDSIVQGVNADGTVDPGAELSVTLNDLDSLKPGIKNYYDAGQLDIAWFKGDFGASEDAGTSFDGNTFSTWLRLQDAGKKVWLSISIKNGLDDTGYNLTGTQYPVYGGEITITAGPSFGSGSKTTGNPIMTTYSFDINNPYLEYTCTGSGISYITYDDVYVKLTRNGESNIVDDQKLTGSSVVFKDVALPVGKKDKFQAIMYFFYGSMEIKGGTFTFEDGAATPSKNKVFATKISSNKAIVRWTGATGATGYEVYMGKKKVKTTKANVYKATISKKGAGKAKFAVYPIVKSGSKKIKGKSTSMKAKANTLNRNITTYYKNYAYGKGQFVIKKISGSGKNYTLTCYAINNRIFKLQKYKKIQVKVYADGKCIINKTIKNKKVNVSAEASKKVTLKVKGKEGDLKHGTVSVSVSYSPYWGKGIQQW